MAVNAVCCARNLFYYYGAKDGKANRSLAICFVLVMGVIGTAASLISGENWYFVLSVTALMINSYAMSFSNPNHIRLSILVTCPMVLIYNCFVHSYGGAVFESVVIVFAIIGLIRYKGEARGNSL